MYWFIFIALMVLSLVVSKVLNARIEKYSKIRLSSGLTGREVAEKMLRDNGIYDVHVLSVSGRLTDHYNPQDKTVNLSEGVYASNRRRCGRSRVRTCRAARHRLPLAGHA